MEDIFTSRKRKHDYSSCGNEDNTSLHEAISQNLLKGLLLLSKHITKVRNKHHEEAANITTTYIKDEYESNSDIEIVNHHLHIKVDSNETEAATPDYLSNSITSLTKRINDLKEVYQSLNIKTDEPINKNSVEMYNTLKSSLLPLALCSLAINSTSLTEQVCDLIQMYKTESTENAVSIRKGLLKVYKKIKSIPAKPDRLQKALDGLQSMKITKVDNETSYLNAASNLAEQIYMLSKKVSKLNKALKKKINNENREKMSVNKKRKTEVIDVDNIDEATVKKKHKKMDMSENDVVLESIDVENDDGTNKKHKSKKGKKHKKGAETIEVVYIKNEMNSETDFPRKNKKNKKDRHLENNAVEGESNKTEKDSYNETREEIVPSKKHKKKKDKHLDNGVVKPVENKNADENHEQSTKSKNKDNNQINAEILSPKKFKQKDKRQKNYVAEQIENKTGDENKCEENTNSKKKHVEETTKVLASTLHDLINNFNMAKANKKNESVDKTNALSESLKGLIGSMNSKKDASKKKQSSDDTVEIKNESEQIYDDIHEDEYEDDTDINNLVDTVLEGFNDEELHVRELLDNAEEKTEIDEETQRKLASLCVLINFPVSPSHEIETKLSAAPTPEQAARLEELGVKGSREPFTSDEDNIIRRNWSNFVREHDLPDDPSPFLRFAHGKEKRRCSIPYKERKKFIQYIGRDLHNRTLYCIARRFRKLLKPFKTGRFTKAEDDIILAHIKSSRGTRYTKFAPLEAVLNRSRTAIECRYRSHLCRENFKVFIWSLDRKEQLIRHLMDATNSKNFEDLCNKNISDDIWKNIGKKMQVAHEKVKAHWVLRLHTQLFAKEAIHLKTFRRDLIEILDEMKATEWRTMKWDNVAKHFDGFTKEYVWLTFKFLIHNAVPKNLRKDLGACVQYLKTNFNHIRCKDTVRKRVKFDENGSLVEYT